MGQRASSLTHMMGTKMPSRPSYLPPLRTVSLWLPVSSVFDLPCAMNSSALR